MPDLLAHLPFTVDDKIGCLRREIKLREKVYPFRCMRGKMTYDEADRETRLMRAILYDYEQRKIGGS